jgi:hypothetical protein
MGSSVAAQLAASQEELGSMELVKSGTCNFLLFSTKRNFKVHYSHFSSNIPVILIIIKYAGTKITTWYVEM